MAVVELCDSSNGTYACQFETSNHDGLHYAYIVRQGALFRMEWEDRWGAVKARRSSIKLPPPPTTKSRNTT